MSPVQRQESLRRGHLGWGILRRRAMLFFLMTSDLLRFFCKETQHGLFKDHFYSHVCLLLSVQDLTKVFCRAEDSAFSVRMHIRSRARTVPGEQRIGNARQMLHCGHALEAPGLKGMCLDMG